MRPIAQTILPQGVVGFETMSSKQFCPGMQAESASLSSVSPPLRVQVVCAVNLRLGKGVPWSNLSRRHVCLEWKSGYRETENWRKTKIGSGRSRINRARLAGLVQLQKVTDGTQIAKADAVVNNTQDRFGGAPLFPFFKQMQGSSRSYRVAARPSNHFVKRGQFDVRESTLVEATKDFRYRSGGFGRSVTKHLTKLDSIDTLYVEQLRTTSDMSTHLLFLLGVLNVFSFSESAHAGEIGAFNAVYGDVGVVLEVGVQLLYLGALLILLGVGSFLVVRQVLIKRELETAAKDLQDRVRTGDASSLDYFELGAVMLRKKFYQLARKYLNEAIKKWDGSEQDLAQVYNALGFSYFSDGKTDLAIGQYEKAVQLQPMYVTAWNNLADAYESQRKYEKALKAYEEALQFDPSNKIATAKRQQMKQRVERFQGIP